MDREPVESSTIRSIGYDPGLAVLEVEFHSGDVYRYHVVPASVHRRLMDADSKGRFFSAHVRAVYPTERVP